MNRIASLLNEIVASSFEGDDPVYIEGDIVRERPTFSAGGRRFQIVNDSCGKFDRVCDLFLSEKDAYERVSCEFVSAHVRGLLGVLSNRGEREAIFERIELVVANIDAQVSVHTVLVPIYGVGDDSGTIPSSGLRIGPADLIHIEKDMLTNIIEALPKRPSDRTAFPPTVPFASMDAEGRARL
jgi:hypothetical protein